MTAVMSRALCLSILFPLVCVSSFSQQSDSTDSKLWKFSATGNLYFLSDDFFVNPVATADRNSLHLEGRYNYEDRQTGSLFVGYQFSCDNELSIVGTPILGAVFGNSNGIAPGFELELTYSAFSFYTEAEYLIEFSDREASFFYAWSELSYSPVEWFWFGLVGQRTRLFHTDVDIQRGILLGLSRSSFSISGYFFNPGEDDSFFVLSLGVEF